MATIRKYVASTTIPKAVRRSYAFPLDASAVWYSYSEMANYAANNPTAYVGQIVSLVDEQGNATAYIIKNVEGELLQVGSGVTSAEEIFGDNRTIVLDKETLSLKNWGVRYYKWDEESETHVLVEVSDSNPWIAGLEPRVDMIDGQPELAWYEPSAITVEDLGPALSGLQTTVDNLVSSIGTKEDAAEVDTIYGNIATLRETTEQQSEKVQELENSLANKVDVTGGALTGVLVLQDGSAAASEKVVEEKIATAVASAGTLKREIVDVLPEVEDADVNTIYMVLNDPTSETDKYNEYMVINGAFELIGDTKVDLTNYIPVVETYDAGDLPEIADGGVLVSAGIPVSSLKNHLANTTVHITTEERDYWNGIGALAEQNAKDIAAIPVLNQHEIDKLAAMPAIAVIGSGLSLDESGVLSATGDGSGYVLPIASENALGGVKSSTADNQIFVDATGIMSVNQISTSNLYIPEGEELVLYGGTSNY